MIAVLGCGANAYAAVKQRLARTRRGALVWLLASAMAALGTADAFPAPRHQNAPMQPSTAAEAAHHKHGSTSDAKRGTPRQSERNRAAHAKATEAEHHKHPDAKTGATARQSERNRTATAPSVRVPIARPAAASLPPDLAAVKQAIELMRQLKPNEVERATSIGDPVARKLVEWVRLRHPDREAAFERHAAFIRANPDWPSIPLLRRRAEARLWQEGGGADTVRRFFGEKQPTSAVGRLALARVLLGAGDRAGAEREVRAVWQSAQLSVELEAATLDPSAMS
jgi:soluble lytic murein transglycosylase